MMKKLCSIVLTLAMLLSAVSMLSFGVSATEAAIVPQVKFAQKTNPTGDKQNIRFVAEVPQSITEAGISALGYDVVATFKKGEDVKKISYNIEGSSVFESLTATYLGETNEVAAEAGKYFFALTIKNVPTNYGEIFLDVKTYSKVGDVKTYSADSSQFCFDDGVEATTKLIYANGFDHLTSGDYYNRAKKAEPTVNNLSTLGFIGNTANNWDAPSATAAIMTVSGEEDKSLSINGFGDIFDLLDADDFEGVSEFTIDLKIKIESLGNLLFMFDGSNATTRVQFRDYWFSTSSGNIWKQGAAESTSNVNNNIFIKLTDTKTYNIRRYTTYPDTTTNNTDRPNAVKYGDTFTLSIKVVKATGDVAVSVNGEEVLTHTFGAITAPVLKLQIQNAPIVLDDIMIYSN